MALGLGLTVTSPFTPCPRVVISRCSSSSDHKYIRKEAAAGRFVGPIAEDQAQFDHISKFGVIPKGHIPGKWRLITDLLSLGGLSVNDGNNLTISSLTYGGPGGTSGRLIGRGVSPCKNRYTVSIYRINHAVQPRDMAKITM